MIKKPILYLLMLFCVISCGKIQGKYTTVNHNSTEKALPFVSQVLWTSVDSHMPHRDKFIKILREQFQAFGIGLLINNNTNYKNKMIFLDIKVKKYENSTNIIDNTEHTNVLIWKLKSINQKTQQYHEKTYEMFVPATDNLWQSGNIQTIRLSVVLGFKHFEKQLNKSFDIIDLNKSENKLYLNVITNGNISHENKRIFTQGIIDHLQEKNVNMVSKNAEHDIKLSIHITRIKITNDIDIFHPKSRLKISWQLTNDENQELLYSFIQENVILDDYFLKKQWKKLVELIAKIGAKSIYLHILTAHNYEYGNVDNNESQINTKDSNHTKRKKLVIPTFQN